MATKPQGVDRTTALRLILRKHTIESDRERGSHNNADPQAGTGQRTQRLLRGLDFLFCAPPPSLRADVVQAYPHLNPILLEGALDVLDSIRPATRHRNPGSRSPRRPIRRITSYPSGRVLYAVPASAAHIGYAPPGVAARTPDYLCFLPSVDDAVGRHGAAPLSVRRRADPPMPVGPDAGGEAAGICDPCAETDAGVGAGEVVEPIEEVASETCYCSCRSFYELNRRIGDGDGDSNGNGGGDTGRSVFMCKHLLAARLAPAFISPSEPGRYMELMIVTDAKFSSCLVQMST